MRTIKSTPDLSLGNIPIAYRLKSQPFMDFDFYVDSQVLIPRVETEEMVEVTIKIIQNLKLKTQNFRIADIGTGSGCIAICLAKYFPEAIVTAVESSPVALTVAKANAERLGALKRIEFILGDFFLPLNTRKFDLIISNPPYIPSDEIENLDSSVKDHEPRMALDGGHDGLDFIRKLIKEGPKHLNPGGVIIFEFGFGQGEDIRHLAPEAEIIRDLAGIERIAIIR